MDDRIRSEKQTQSVKGTYLKSKIRHPARLKLLPDKDSRDAFHNVTCISGQSY